MNPGDLVITAGRQSGKLSSFYPRGIPIGRVTKVGQTDVDPFQDVQLVPFVDFSSLDASRPRQRQAATADAVTLSIAKTAALFFVVAILEVTIVASIGILGGSPDLVLVTSSPSRSHRARSSAPSPASGPAS